MYVKFLLDENMDVFHFIFAYFFDSQNYFLCSGQSACRLGEISLDCCKMWPEYQNLMHCGETFCSVLRVQHPLLGVMLFYSFFFFNSVRVIFKCQACCSSEFLKLLICLHVCYVLYSESDCTFQKQSKCNCLK